MKHNKRLPILGCLALSVVGCGSAAHAATPTGPFVYVANKPLSTGGALKPLSPLTVPAGPFPYTIAVDPQGTSVA